MAQKRLDGSDEPPKDRSERRVLIREKLLRVSRSAKINYRQKVDEGVRLGIFSLQQVVDAAYEQWEREIETEARRMNNKDGTPAIIPDADHPHQGILLEAAETKDRFVNVLRRGLQTFGHQRRWRRCVEDMADRGEETLPVAEFKEGAAEILKVYREAAAASALDSRAIEDDEDQADE